MLKVDKKKLKVNVRNTLKKKDRIKQKCLRKVRFIHLYKIGINAKGIVWKTVSQV